jgi:diguanylate cyclase (GGDEF)-like protein
MGEFKSLQLSIFCLLLLGSILIDCRKYINKIFVQDKMFRNFIIINMLMLVVEISSWVFDNKPGYSNYILNCITNLLLYIIGNIPCLYWALYINYYIYQDEDKLDVLKMFLYPLFSLNALLSVLSLKYNFFYYIDENNLYHRGDYFWLHIIITYSFIIYSQILIFRNRKKIGSKNYSAILFTPLAPLLGGLIQTYFYGYCLVWVGLTFSILIVYFNMKNRSLNTDYLTGAYNRRQLDSYIEHKIHNCSAKRSFSAILLDLDKFKQINDSFGHDWGDEVLKKAVHLIKENLRKNDFLARYGGDEFYVILDISDRDQLEKVVARIRNTVKDYEKNGDNPYKISFSMGYDIYDYSLKKSSRDFLKHIDRLMYKDKKSKSLYA